MDDWNNVLIISSSETFTVRGLAMNLQSIGVQSVYAVPKVSELGAKVEKNDLIILYTDEAITLAVDVLVYLKDCCAEKNKKVIVIGSQDEYNSLIKTLSESSVYQFMERPLNMEKFLDCVENYFSESAQQAKRKSILIVDDDVTYMSMIMDWLKDQYRVSVANSGMQAITWLANNHPDLILLDYEMPVTSGPKVLEMIRSDVATADIPVMFLTGKGDKDSVIRVMQLRPVGYQLKSIDRATLRDNIAKFFASQNAR